MKTMKKEMRSDRKSTRKMTLKVILKSILKRHKRSTLGEALSLVQSKVVKVLSPLEKNLMMTNY